MAKALKSKNEEAWEKIFQEHDVTRKISSGGAFRISAEQIRAHREPRLMAKIDHRVNLPGIFTEHNLAILPVSRGDYLISDFKAYHEFETTAENIKTLPLPAHIHSINPDTLTSECVALNCALAAGIFQDFLGEAELTPTVSGRMGSGEFEFRIDKASGGQTTVQVKNSQIEIDLALEGPQSLCLIEAKSDISDDFIIRQLYYPYRSWLSKLSGKRIRPVFMVCSNGIFRLYEYEFTNPAHYNSIRLVRQKSYSVENTTIREQEIKALRKSLTAVSEPALPFPQADKFERVINLCELLKDNPASQNDIAEEYDFELRQSDYYANAGRYLGLIDKTREGGQTTFRVTEKALDLLRLPYKQRQLELCRCILEHKVFAEALDYYFRHQRLPGKPEVVGMMKKANLYGIGSESTYGRRASTIIGWVRWIVGLWDKNIK